MDRAARTRTDPVDGPPTSETTRAFCTRPPLELARALLGCRIVSTIGSVEVSGTIVETEAYGGPEDPASHACTTSGITDRNRAMFGPPGRVYVYRSYGVHWCLNVVSGRDGEPGAVLVRGLDPVSGTDVMRTRRSGRQPLAAGPGRLCEALGVTGELYGHDLARAPLRMFPGTSVPSDRVGASGRVGVRRAADWPHRFYVRGAAGVSRPDGWNPVASRPKRRTSE